MKTLFPNRRLRIVVLGLGVIFAWALFQLWPSAGTPAMHRIRALLALLSLGFLLASFESIRRGKLKEGYALLWILPTFGMLFLCFLPESLEIVHQYFGLAYSSVMAGIAFLFLLCAVFVICRILTRQERCIVQMAQRIALLEARLRETRENNGAPRS